MPLFPTQRFGPVAQLGAHYIRIVGVGSSNLLGSTKIHRNFDRIAVDFFYARKPLERQAHIRILSKSDRLRSVQRHRDLKLCGVVLFIANRKMIRKNFDL